VRARVAVQTGTGTVQRLVVRFDKGKATADALRRGRAFGAAGAAGGAKAGSHGFGTGPQDPQKSAAVASVAVDAGALTLAMSSAAAGGADDFEVLIGLQRALDKALFANAAT
jgi:hypothetical protein